LASKDNLQQGEFLHHLADMLMRRYWFTAQSTEDLNGSLRAYQLAAEHQLSSPGKRIISALSGAMSHGSNGNIERAFDMLRSAIELIPALAPRTLDRVAQQSKLQYVSRDGDHPRVYFHFRPPPPVD